MNAWAREASTLGKDPVEEEGLEGRDAQWSFSGLASSP